jgi:hypothetical protein
VTPRAGGPAARALGERIGALRCGELRSGERGAGPTCERDRNTLPWRAGAARAWYTIPNRDLEQVGLPSTLTRRRGD